MKAPIKYISDFSKMNIGKEFADKIGVAIDNEIEWVRRDNTPRQEAFYSKVNAPYTYGKGVGVRTYYPNLVIPAFLQLVWDNLERDYGTQYEACFLNKYEHGNEHLGWHADNSDVIDDTRPIAVISYGAERELWFRANPHVCYACNGSGRYDHNGSPTCGACNGTGKEDTQVEKLLLETGSLCIMEAGMQDTHQHRIPKAGKVCGTRISLTFRGLNLWTQKEIDDAKAEAKATLAAITWE